MTAVDPDTLLRLTATATNSDVIFALSVTPATPMRPCAHAPGLYIGISTHKNEFYGAVSLTILSGPLASAKDN
jgi:hypothetical protein|tara:strand:- start:1190 stop:1408 length:219 start_codon:yes stop_codon:yes gene_type:complete